MPVIINDFEIDTQPSTNGNQSPSTPPTTQQAAPPPSALKPQDIWLIVRHQQVRQLRLRAH